MSSGQVSERRNEMPLERVQQRPAPGGEQLHGRQVVGERRLRAGVSEPERPQPAQMRGAPARASA